MIGIQMNMLESFIPREGEGCVFHAWHFFRRLLELEALSAGARRQPGRFFLFLAFLAAACVLSSAAALGQPSGYIVQFQTLSNSFSPEVFCDGGAPQSFLWTWSDGTTSTNFPIATKSFGSRQARYQYLNVSPPEALTLINLGFDGSDGGWTNIYGARPSQGVGAVYFPAPLTNLQYWTSAYDPITNTMDFTGFTALQNAELWHCYNLQHVRVANLPSLRRLCVEGCSLQELDVSGNPNLEDVRGALNAYTGVQIGGGTGPRIWHWCFRDNPQITQDFKIFMTNFYSLQEPWFWNANQGGALKFVSTNLTDVEIYDNHYTSADFAGENSMFECWIFSNDLTNLVIDGCGALQTFDAHDNQLPTQALDSLLTELDLNAPNLAFADLTANAGMPSYVGYSHFANLTNRGVVAYVDWPSQRVVWPQMALDSTALVSESCTPANGVIDPGETVVVSLGLRNAGAGSTSNLVVTLLATNGVAAPSGPQTYGVVPPGGTASLPFTFTAAGECGGTIYATFLLEEPGGLLGTISVPFHLGLTVPFFTENFDGASVPGLPAGWSTSASGADSPWFTTNSLADTAPDDAFTADAPAIGLSELDSPPILLPGGPVQLSFRNNYNLELNGGTDGYDGGVLEIRIGANDYSDILTAGGNFLSGGYNCIIDSNWGNPLAGRQAWSGNSGGYITTLVNLPTAAQGQTVQFRWLCGTDSDNGRPGWRIDTVALLGGQCCGNTVQPPPTIGSVVRQGDTIAVWWNTVPGRYYRLQYKTNLDDPGWSDVTPDILAAGPVTVSTNLMQGASQRFYRVMVVP